MDFSMFLISLLLATVSSISLDKSSMMTKLFQNPRAFADTFQNAKPSEINAVIEMIVGLIAAGNKEKETAIAAFNDAEAAFDDADLAETTAMKAEWQLVGHYNVTKETVQNQQLVLANDEQLEASLLMKLNGLKKVQEDAQLDFDMGIQQIDAEKDQLEGIKKILKKMAGKTDRRRLLAMVKIDPDALEAVSGIVEGLLMNGEDERRSLTETLKTAKDNTDGAQGQYDEAVRTKIDAADKLSRDKAAQDTAKEEADAATKAYLEAKNDKDEKKSILEKERTTKTEISSRVDTENGTLDSVNQMLRELLPKKSN